MKRVLIIVVAIVFGVAFSECFAKKPNKAMMTELDMIPMRTGPAPVEDFYSQMPCMEESYDTVEEMRSFGVGEGQTEEQAKEDALRNAINIIIERMPMHVRSVTTVSETGSHTETIVESAITEEQKQSIYANSEIVCFKIVLNESNTYQAFVAISVPRKESHKEDNIKDEILQHFDSMRFKEQMKKQFDELNNIIKE